MVPLDISNGITLGGLTIDKEHYYYVLKESCIIIPEGGKLVTLFEGWGERKNIGEFL
jgi:hypothetical protein